MGVFDGRHLPEALRRASLFVWFDWKYGAYHASLHVCVGMG